MKKLILSAVIILGIHSFKAQTWGGSTSQTGDTYRTGNIGLRTSTPTQALHIGAGNQLFNYYSASPSGGNLYFGGVTTSLVNGMRMTYVSSSATAYLDVRSSISTGGLSFRVDGNNGGIERMRILPNGNIGIGTSNPTTKLTVNGKTLIGDPSVVVNFPDPYKLYVQGGMLAQMVRVAVPNSSSWADYVFEKNYKLLPLHEVEKFVLKEKHLPEVPSACDVEKNGIDMVEMNSTLLKKIEELTLYVIELKKENEAQTKRLDFIEVTRK